jgi:hypothetical protein
MAVVIEGAVYSRVRGLGIQLRISPGSYFPTGSLDGTGNFSVTSSRNTAEDIRSNREFPQSSHFFTGFLYAPVILGDQATSSRNTGEALSFDCEFSRAAMAPATLR